MKLFCLLFSINLFFSNINAQLIVTYNPTLEKYVIYNQDKTDSLLKIGKPIIIKSQIFICGQHPYDFVWGNNLSFSITPYRYDRNFTKEASIIVEIKKDSLNDECGELKYLLNSFRYKIRGTKLKIYFGNKILPKRIIFNFKTQNITDFKKYFCESVGKFYPSNKNCYICNYYTPPLLK